MRSKKGFTLIELIVVLAVIAILAAILTPVIGRYIDDARRSTAARDVQNLAAAINMFYKDLGSYPGWTSTASPVTITNEAAGGAAFDFLFSSGDAPQTTVSYWSKATGTEDEMADHLFTNSVGYRTSGRFIWKGPYHNDFKDDPWGNYYAFNSKYILPNTHKTKALFVISAGPDEDLETTDSQPNTTAFAATDDDIAFQIR